MKKLTILAVAASILAAGGAYAGAVRDSDHQAERRASVEAARNAVTPEQANDGERQLAAQLGVNAADYTLAELLRIEDALRSGNVKEASFVLSHANRQVPGAAGEVSAGKAQMAALLGVDPADYSLSELTGMAAPRQGRND